ncbi:glycosyltransferase family 2 protein [Bacillus sp. ISL-46]|nr:glycosyltransferase family 2 protein [Bacillus sp. ISL-46]
MVMAVYYGKRFLKESFEHALKQTYSELEMIIVNDGSKDLTKTILEEVKDERVRVIHLEKNQGAAHALKIGIDKLGASRLPFKMQMKLDIPRELKNR